MSCKKSLVVLGKEGKWVMLLGYNGRWKETGAWEHRLQKAGVGDEITRAQE